MYKIRYPFGEQQNETNNYGAWAPTTAKLNDYIEEDKKDKSIGLGYHQFIPGDY